MTQDSEPVTKSSFRSEKGSLSLDEGVDRKGAKTQRKRKEEANVFDGNSLRPFIAPSRLCG
jgi:hypothetical protein